MNLTRIKILQPTAVALSGGRYRDVRPGAEFAVGDGPEAVLLKNAEWLVARKMAESVEDQAEIAKAES